MLTPQNLRMPIALFQIFDPNTWLPVDLQCHVHLYFIATHLLLGSICIMGKTNRKDLTTFGGILEL